MAPSRPRSPSAPRTFRRGKTSPKRKPDSSLRAVKQTGARKKSPGKNRSKVASSDQSGNSATARLKPVWDKADHALYLGGQLVHRFKKEARDEEPILDAFQEARWVQSIDYAAAGTKQKLRNTITNLNRRVRCFLRFHQERSGSRLRWEMVLKSY